MNTIAPNSIHVDHGIKDCDGKKYTGFYAIFQKEDEEATSFQIEILDIFNKKGYLTCFDTVENSIELLLKHRL